jgi:thiol-disulfide isomerase/thioredoxin
MNIKPTLATSEFCGPCKILKTQLEQFAASYDTKDLSRDAGFFIENGIRSVPTLVCHDGTKITNSAEILDFFKKHETSQS